MHAWHSLSLRLIQESGQANQSSESEAFCCQAEVQALAPYFTTLNPIRVNHRLKGEMLGGGSSD